MSKFKIVSRIDFKSNPVFNFVDLLLIGSLSTFQCFFIVFFIWQCFMVLDNILKISDIAHDPPNSASLSSHVVTDILNLLFPYDVFIMFHT